MTNQPKIPGPKGKYAPLYRHLLALGAAEWSASFEEIEGVLGFRLPRSARLYQPWWSNQRASGSHSHAQAWQRAGWKVRGVDLLRERVVFERTTGREAPGAAGGLSEDASLREEEAQGPASSATAPQEGAAHALFEQLARWVMSDAYGVSLAPRRPAGVDKLFDMTSPDLSLVGDAKYFTMVGGQQLPPAKLSIISEHVWLLEKTGAKDKFLVFGNDRRVPECWIKKYGGLASEITFYFLSDDGHLEVLKEGNAKASATTTLEE
jgi:hypothetical protein